MPGNVDYTRLIAEVEMLERANAAEEGREPRPLTGARQVVAKASGGDLPSYADVEQARRNADFYRGMAEMAEWAGQANADALLAKAATPSPRDALAQEARQHFRTIANLHAAGRIDRATRVRLERQCEALKQRAALKITAEEAGIDLAKALDPKLNWSLLEPADTRALAMKAMDPASDDDEDMDAEKRKKPADAEELRALKRRADAQEDEDDRAVLQAGLEAKADEGQMRKARGLADWSRLQKAEAALAPHPASAAAKRELAMANWRERLAEAAANGAPASEIAKTEAMAHNLGLL